MSYLARFPLGLVMAVCAAAICGCHETLRYSGDGQLTDNGPFASTDRYVLNLGPIDFTERGKRAFRIVNLPPANYVVGIEISTAPEDRASIEGRLISPVIRLSLSDAGGKVLFAHDSALDTWTWSVKSPGTQAFVYERGEPGTYFSAAPRAEYALTLTVIKPDSRPVKYAAHLVATSGG